MTTLTDRYVWAVLRSVPEGQRGGLEPELRALVADAIEAHAHAGSPDAAERAALVELGDPDVLAGRYVDRPRFLIGPRFYPEWLRLLSILLPILIPIIAIVVGASAWIGGQPVGQVITSAAGAAVGVAVQTAFWVTLVFALVERTTAAESLPVRAWTPDQLPALPATGRLGLGEAAASIAANVVLVAILMASQTMSLIVIEGTAYPLFDPALWSFWLPYFIAIAVLEIVFAVGLYLRGRWTWGFALANAALNAAFAIPALRLLQEGQLFNPALTAKLESLAGGAWFGPTTSIIAIVIAAVSAWDAIDGFRKAWRNHRQDRVPVGNA